MSADLKTNEIGKGKPGPGRPKGLENKATRQAKEAIEYVFDSLGGAEALKTWVQSDPLNERVFYSQVWPKILPKEIKADVTHRGWFNVLAGFGGDTKDD